ncbi:hypothetical protein DSB65_07355 [Lactobacillus delbrueckii]|nr:hypothetical protein [Lactobacillus delbrueckii]
MYDYCIFFLDVYKIQILGAFGLDEEWIKAQARQIGKDIQNAAMPEEQKDDDEDAENEEY